MGAFVGLTVSSLWQDELYTGWIVDPANGWTTMATRALHDVGPPLYYVLLWPVVQFAGDSEIGLRLFSTLCAVASILLFVVGGASFFSLRARLFAAAMAVGSSYWFVQAQNARFYALALLLSTGMMLLGLGALRRERSLAGLFALMAVASFTHFYLLYESLGVLAALFLYRPGQRLRLVAAGVLLLLAILLYVKLVIFRLSYAATDDNWIPNTAGWYAQNLHAMIQDSLTHKAMLALAVCAVAGAIALAPKARHWSASSVPSWFAARGDLLLCIAAPLAVISAGVVGSFVMTPNFHSRYVLVCSPFLWALLAFFYDRGVGIAAPIVRRATDLALAAIVIWMAVTLTANRSKPAGEPFRESAEAIRAIPACRGQVIPAVVSERKRWFRSPEGLQPIRAAYAKYLYGFAEPQLIYLEDLVSGDLSPEWKTMLRERIDGAGCPVLAWAVHGLPPSFVDEIRAKILQVTGREAKAADLELVISKEAFESYLFRARRSTP